MKDRIRYRQATRTDMPAVYRLVRELARFEQAEDQVATTVASYERDGFGDEPWFQCIVAEDAEAGVIGIALFYRAFSTWKGRMIYLDDLVVREDFRGQGIGRALLQRLLDQARAAGVAMVKWQVLDWNQPAIELYKKIGATFDGEWIDCKYYFSRTANQDSSAEEFNR